MRQRHRFSITASALIDVLVVAISTAFAFWLRFNVLAGEEPVVNGWTHVLWAVTFSPVFIFLYSFAGIYNNHSSYDRLRVGGKLILCNSVAIMLFIDVVFLFRLVDYSRWLIVIDWATINVLSVLKFLITTKYQEARRAEGLDQIRVLVIGSGQGAAAYTASVSAQEASRHRVIGSVGEKAVHPLNSGELDPFDDIPLCPHLGKLDNLAEVLENMRPDQVVLAFDTDEQDALEEAIVTCEATGVGISLLPPLYEYISARPVIDQQAGLPVIQMNLIAMDSTASAFLKRAFDVVGSAVLILLTSPIMIFAAVATRLSSPGPIIFKQERIGRGRKPFYIYKFRSMRMNDTSDSAWTSSGDPRRTKWGAFMRRYSIDELPQLFNVLFGDMSLVGPRPEIPAYVNHFKTSVPLYLVRHRVRPGMTGWAQVNGLRGDTSIEKRVEFDLYYIENWSMLFDLKILLMTPTRGVVNQQETLG